MKDGMFVFDAAVHCQDFTDSQIKPGSDGRRVRILREQLNGFIDLTARRGPPPMPDLLDAPDLDWANADAVRELRHRPGHGVLGAAVRPLEGRSGPGRAELRAGRVQPVAHPADRRRRSRLSGPRLRARGDGAPGQGMGRRQHEVLPVPDRAAATGAPTTATSPIRYGKRRIELGIKMVQFHKGFPLELGPVEAFMPNDIQYAAADFPELNFGIHHLGDPYVDETISIASRFENVYLILPLWFNQYFLQPHKMLHRLGRGAALMSAATASATAPKRSSGPTSSPTSTPGRRWRCRTSCRTNTAIPSSPARSRRRSSASISPTASASI